MAIRSSKSPSVSPRPALEPVPVATFKQSMSLEPVVLVVMSLMPVQMMPLLLEAPLVEMLQELEAPPVVMLPVPEPMLAELLVPVLALLTAPPPPLATTFKSSPRPSTAQPLLPSSRTKLPTDVSSLVCPAILLN